MKDRKDGSVIGTPTGSLSRRGFGKLVVSGFASLIGGRFIAACGSSPLDPAATDIPPNTDVDGGQPEKALAKVTDIERLELDVERDPITLRELDSYLQSPGFMVNSEVILSTKEIGFLRPKGDGVFSEENFSLFQVWGAKTVGVDGGEVNLPVFLELLRGPRGGFRAVMRSTEEYALYRLEGIDVSWDQGTLIDFDPTNKLISAGVVYCGEDVCLDGLVVDGIIVPIGQQVEAAGLILPPVDLDGDAAGDLGEWANNVYLAHFKEDASLINELPEEYTGGDVVTGRVTEVRNVDASAERAGEALFIFPNTYATFQVGQKYFEMRGGLGGFPTDASKTTNGASRRSSDIEFQNYQLVVDEKGDGVWMDSSGRPRFALLEGRLKKVTGLDEDGRLKGVPVIGEGLPVLHSREVTVRDIEIVQETVVADSLTPVKKDWIWNMDINDPAARNWLLRFKKALVEGEVGRKYIAALPGLTVLSLEGLNQYLNDNNYTLPFLGAEVGLPLPRAYFGAYADFGVTGAVKNGILLDAIKVIVFDREMWASDLLLRDYVENRLMGPSNLIVMGSVSAIFYGLKVDPVDNRLVAIIGNKEAPRRLGSDILGGYDGEFDVKRDPLVATATMEQISWLYSNWRRAMRGRACANPLSTECGSDSITREQLPRDPNGEIALIFRPIQG